MITKIINKSTAEGTFKTFDCKNKENYRFFSLLSHMLKVFERILYKPNDFMKDKLPKIFTGFQKGHIAQHSSLITIEKWKRALDENMKVGAIFMNLSKARDTLNNLGFFWLNLKHIVFNQLF